MTSCNTSAGVISVGDTIVFNYPSGKKIGKVRAIEETINTVSASVYCIDDTGGYTLSVPHFNIIEKADVAKEEIEKPKRYNKKGKLECWDVIIDQEMNFLEGNILKYLWRYKEKKGAEDLKKAKVYLEKLISEIEKK